MNVDESNVDVYLDGNYQLTVNCWSSTRVTQARLFSATNLSAESHTLKLVKRGGTYLVVDALAVTPTNFWLTATPNSGSANAVVAFTNVIKLDTYGGYAGTTTFSVSGLPAGATASFNPPTVTGAGFTFLTVTVATNTPLVTTNLTIYGTGGGVSNLVTATLTVSAASPPAITAQPASQTIAAGSNATFSVTTSGTVPSYQWFKNGVALSDGGHISGTATATLSLSHVSSSDAAGYTVVVSNVLKNVTSSNAILTVLVPTPPQITSLSLSGGSMLVLQGSGGPTNGGYYYWLLCSTNLNLPLTNWNIIATNPFDLYGNFSNQIPVTPGSPQLFYRIQMP
jgi:hypothetical protein